MGLPHSPSAHPSLSSTPRPSPPPTPADRKLHHASAEPSQAIAKDSDQPIAGAALFRRRPVSERLHEWVHQAQLHSILVFFAIWGLLTRLGLNAIGEFDGRSVFSLLLVQVVGCLIMGASVSLKDRFDKTHNLLYLGMTTGYCGSVTTFSSWMLQVFQAFINSSHVSRGGFKDFLDGLNQTYVTAGLCLFALQTGFQLGHLIDKTFARAQSPPVEGSLSLTETDKPSDSLSGLIALSGPATWLGSIFLFVYGPRHWRGPVTYSMIISPFGTLLRFYLAKLNLHPLSTKHGFPMGTFLANAMATGLLAILTFLQYTTKASEMPELCGGLQGLKDGFCGCLSTISTFFLELHKAGMKSRSCRYAVSSWVVGQVLCVLLLGIYSWKNDLGDRCKFPT